MKKSNKLWCAIIYTGDKISVTKFYKTYNGLRRYICRQYKNISYFAFIKSIPVDMEIRNDSFMTLKTEQTI